MFRLIGFVLKVSIFAAIVLVLGNWLHWRGKTISDQVKTQLSHAEKSDFLNDVTHEATKAERWAKKLTSDAAKTKEPQQRRPSQDADEIPSSERQKLKALIRELNSSHGKDQ